MAEKRCVNNSDSSDKKQAHKTHSFERKLDILKRTDNGEGHRESTFIGAVTFHSKYICKNRVKIVEHVRSASSLQSIVANPKQSVVIEQMEHLLKVWGEGGDHAQRRIPVSQAITSAKAKSLKCYKVIYEETKKASVKLKLDQFFIKQPIE
jgi:hypothetical protein